MKSILMLDYNFFHKQFLVLVNILSYVLIIHADSGLAQGSVYDINDTFVGSNGI
jgi:hypothetical protein